MFFLPVMASAVDVHGSTWYGYRTGILTYVWKDKQEMSPIIFPSNDIPENVRLFADWLRGFAGKV